MSVITVDHCQGDDQLGRVALAELLVSLASNMSSTVQGATIGLEGPWGSGKSTVFMLMKDVINTNVVLVDFNPWMVSGARELIEIMLDQISSALAEFSDMSMVSVGVAPSKIQEVALKVSSYAGILRYAKYAAPALDFALPGLGATTSLLISKAEDLAEISDKSKEYLESKKNELKSLSLSKKKNLTRDALKDLGLKILVVVDDLDRLPPNEISEIVRAIKAVADFPNVVYILGYDKSVVAGALTASLKVDGLKFLDKIIQYEIAMPKPTADLFKKYVESELLCHVNGFWDRFGQSEKVYFAKLVSRSLTTPREVQRVKTRMLVALEVYGDGLNGMDLLLLEILFAKWPLLIDWINDRRLEIFDFDLRILSDNVVEFARIGKAYQDSYTHSLIGKKTHKREVFESYRKDWLALYPSKDFEIDSLCEVMGFLFDSCRPYEFEFKRLAYRRVSDFQYWYGWECFFVGSDEMNPKRLQELLNSRDDLFSYIRYGSVNDFEKFMIYIVSVVPTGVRGVDSLIFVDFVGNWLKNYLYDDLLGVLNNGLIQNAIVSVLRSSSSNILDSLRYIVDNYDAVAAVRVLYDVKSSGDAECLTSYDGVDILRFNDADWDRCITQLFGALDQYYGNFDRNLDNERGERGGYIDLYYPLFAMKGLGRDVGLISRVATDFFNNKNGFYWIFFRAADEFRSMIDQLDWSILPSSNIIYKYMSDKDWCRKDFLDLWNLVDSRYEVTGQLGL